MFKGFSAQCRQYKLKWQMSNLLETVSQGIGPNDSRKNRTLFKHSPINAYYTKNLQNRSSLLPDMDTLQFKSFAWSHSYHFQRSSVISSICFLFSVMIFNLKLIHFLWWIMKSDAHKNPSHWRRGVLCYRKGRRFS